MSYLKFNYYKRSGWDLFPILTDLSFSWFNTLRFKQFQNVQKQLKAKQCALRHDTRKDFFLHVLTSNLLAKLTF